MAEPLAEFEFEVAAGAEEVLLRDRVASSGAALAPWQKPEIGKAITATKDIKCANFIGKLKRDHRTEAQLIIVKAEKRQCAGIFPVSIISTRRPPLRDGSINRRLYIIIVIVAISS